MRKIESDVLSKRISWKQKKANDFEWAKQCVDYVDSLYLPYRDRNRLKRLQMNYDLYNGHGEKAMMDYGKSENERILAEEGIMSGYEGVQHHPIIDQIAKALVGEQQLRPFDAIAFDSSGYTLNDKKRKKLALYQDHIQQTIVEPMKAQVTQQYMMEMGIKDPYSLSPEQQQEFSKEVDQRIKFSTPKEIEDYMRKDYKSPQEIQAQKLLDFLLDYLDLKFTTDEGFKHAVITGEEIYRVGIRHNMPFVELVDPMGFYNISRPNSFFIEDSIAAKYEQYVLLSDVYNWHGDEIGTKQLIKDKLDAYASGDFGEKVIDDQIYRSPSRLENIPNIMTKAGQEGLKSLFQEYSVSKKGGDLRYTHVTWKALRRLKRICRVTEGEKKHFWVDESYTFNPLKGDVSQKEAWVPEVWQAIKIDDDIYLDIGPVPYQHRSVDNPWDVKLPYIGAQYSKLMNNTENVAPMDLAKPWQYKFNLQMAKIHEMEAADMGKVFLTSFHAKPKDWSWQKYILMAKYGKIIPVDLQQEGVTPADAQIFKGIDLSTVNDLAGKLQYLEFIRNQISLSMSYNPSRLGMQANSVSVSNNQQNIVQSSYQTYDIYNMHNKIVENLLNSLINCARIAFKENGPMRSYILDDMSIAELELDWEMINRLDLGVKVRNSSQDFENILQVKQQAQAMIQNGLISFPELIRLQWAKSGADIMNIAENAEERNAKMRQEAQQAEQEQMQQQAQIQQQLQKMQQDFELLKQANELQSREKQSQIESTRFAQQEDINRNEIADKMELEQMRIEYDTYKMEKEHELKLNELDLKRIDLEIKAKGLDDKVKIDLERAKADKEFQMKKLQKEMEIKEKELEIKKKQKTSNNK